ncbi:MAG: hypothetical protein QOK02_6612 [Mycobacterium sp.]|jgi:hypothetical protein|nr:hypothetical protein [Mycobacterium sp.]
MHYRSGSDCAVCLPGTCHRFRAATPLRIRLHTMFTGPISEPPSEIERYLQSA